MQDSCFIVVRIRIKIIGYTILKVRVNIVSKFPSMLVCWSFSFSEMDILYSILHL